MSEWKKPRVQIAERLAEASAQLKAAIPILVERQVKAVEGMAKVVGIAQGKQ